MTANKPKIKNQNRVLSDQNFEFCQKILALVVGKSLSKNAALAALNAIPATTSVQKKWLAYWKANVIMNDAASCRFGRKFRAAQIILERLIPAGFGLIAEEEIEVTLYAMLALAESYRMGGLDVAWEQAVETYARLNALATFYEYDSIRIAAEQNYKEICEYRPQSHFEYLCHLALDRADKEAAEAAELAGVRDENELVDYIVEVSDDAHLRT